ncbi:hypothetical protein [Halobacillus seohaensis]|uniref:Uncharacterized protein n=1 Tax=Halobacillus seohaensis TaxID=447421 RepID=A0ABW2EMT4_9BACI
MDAIKISHYKNEFLSFYQQAALNSRETDRFSIWKKYYGFNPYVKEDSSDQLAKEMLEMAYPKYEEALHRIESFHPNESEIYNLLSLIREELCAFEPMQLSIVFFVGDFETDPFIEKEVNESFTLYFPIEIEYTPSLLANELAKVIHLNQSKLNPISIKNIAHVIFLEGLALHTTHQVTPSEFNDSNLYPWMAKCRQEPTRIMMNILPHLRRTDYKAMYSFTKGTGASGYINEAGFVGWVVTKHLLESEYTLADLQMVGEDQTTSLIEQALYQVMEETKYIQSQE